MQQQRKVDISMDTTPAAAEPAVKLGGTPQLEVMDTFFFGILHMFVLLSFFFPSYHTILSFSCFLWHVILLYAICHMEQFCN